MLNFVLMLTSAFHQNHFYLRLVGRGGAGSSHVLHNLKIHDIFTAGCDIVATTHLTSCPVNNPVLTSSQAHGLNLGSGFHVGPLCGLCR